METSTSSLREVFVNEALAIILKCATLLMQLRLTPRNLDLINQILVLADNICEPAQTVGANVVFDIADRFRTTVAKLATGEIPVSQECLSILEQACAYMRCLLALKLFPDPKSIDNSGIIADFERLWLSKTPLDVGPPEKTKANAASIAAGDILVHDLKSPLGVIRTSADNLLRMGADPKSEQMENGLKRILRQADKGLALIRATLTQSSAGKSDESQGRQLIPVKELFEACIRELVDSAQPQGIRLRLSVDPQEQVFANPLYLRQILDNLVSNAIKFSPRGGSVVLKCERVQIPESDFQRRALLFQVIDRGKGIAAKEIPYIFMEGVQGQRGKAIGGHGLGLAICKTYCEWHGGTIWVQSRAGQGTTFSFIIPWRQKP